ncbi:MAG: hypothetical protein ACOC1L_05180, partial [Bacillota bacterium]
MKTIAFLSVLFSVLLVSPQSVSMQSKSHDSIKTEVEKGEITIIYEGDNRFTTHVSTGDYTYYVNQTLRNNDTTIVYGFTIDKPLREHHAFILFLNSDGEIIRHDVFEDIKLAEFIEHYQFEDSLIFRMRESIEEEYSTKEVKNHFFRYEDNFATYQTETIDSEIKVIDVVEDKLVMKQAYNEPYAYGL